MYGEDDFVLGKKYNLPQHHTVDSEGKITADVPQFTGKFVKAADPEIIADLQSRNLLVGEPQLAEHEYPFCYRCDSPLIYYALSSWFIKVTAVKDQLVAANNNIHWVPAHVKEGRFGKWLEGARDWAVSRNRYWGAPLPIWQCADCHATKVLSDPAELATTAAARNAFFLLRHGEAENNVLQILASEREGGKYGLTDLGRQQVATAVEQVRAELKKLGKSMADVRLIVSPIRRAQETAQLISTALKLTANQLITDARVRELDLTSFDGQAYGAYEAARAAGQINSGVTETPEHIAHRIREAMTELNSQTTGLVYMVVSHGDPIWLLQQVVAGKPTMHTHQLRDGQVIARENYPAQAELLSIAIPWLDLHRPYIDEITFPCACGGTMQRVPEVFDCWFESGSMPFAQYGARTRATADELVSNKLIPADFIAEGLDQTRGWFYTLHVLAVALFGVPAYQNVVVNGLILASDGKKLSKRLKNYTPPDELFAKWGVDPVRYFLLASTTMGEDYRFTDEGVQQSFRQVIQLLWNVTEFYQLYKSADQSNPLSPDQLKAVHVMDCWLLARLASLIEEMIKAMDQYDLTKASRQLGSFVDDLSIWYIRRSRERIKSNEAGVIAILQSVLHQLAIMMAPFMPFMAERVYHAVGGVKDSVHLEDWLVSSKSSSELLDSMEQVRAIAEAVHALRSSAKIKLRQPLASVCVTGMSLDVEHQQLLAEEVNVETVATERGNGEWVEASLGSATIALRIDLSADLKARGLVREFVRQINSLRKEQGLTVHDKVQLIITAPADLTATLLPYENVLREAVQASTINWEGKGTGVDLEIGDSKVKVELGK
jgi:isoleucyl-tRNA synthetase